MIKQLSAPLFAAWAERWIGLSLFGRKLGFWRQDTKVKYSQDLKSAISMTLSDGAKSRYAIRVKLLELQPNFGKLLGTLPYVVAEYLLICCPRQNGVREDQDLWIAWPADFPDFPWMDEVEVGNSKALVETLVNAPSISIRLPGYGF